MLTINVGYGVLQFAQYCGDQPPLAGSSFAEAHPIDDRVGLAERLKRYFEIHTLRCAHLIHV